MGVPKFYRWLSERYPCLSEVVKEHQIPEFDNLYLDMNGIIHICSHPNDDDPHFRITEEKIFQDIFHYIEVLFRMIQPRKVFFMAVDGVAPRAKMNQQRGRRFRSAREAEMNEKRAKDRGEELPKEARFDSNCITPGTPFMVRLQAQLQYFVNNKITHDPLWHNTKVILSGHEVPGEGEHKIMDFIRHERSKDDYDSNTRHCLYGLDADLMMLGLCTHDPHFSLLREEVRFGKKTNANASKRTPTPEETTFHLLHLSLLREYIEHEFGGLKEKITRFEFDVERIIDDWILMGFLVGNDFIPHLPHMHINKGALPELYQAYKDVLPTLDGYINEAGTLNLPRFEKFLSALSDNEMDRFDDIYCDNKWLEGKRAKKKGNGKHIVQPTPGPGNVYEMLEGIPEPGVNQSGRVDSELERLLKSTDEFFDEDAEEDSPEEEVMPSDDSRTADYHMEFRQHKRDYYIQKLGYSEVNESVLRDQAEGYVRAIQWNLHYYYNGCCSWSWYYPHHYSPWITDIKGFSNMDMSFELSKPFLPFEQLLSVLPAASKDLLPQVLQGLMLNQSSPIIDYYPEDFENDLNGKQQDWEAVVLIPFIDEKRLLEAMAPLVPHMLPEEKARNKHGPMNVYTYSVESIGSYEAPAYFPNIELNHALHVPVWREDWDVPREKLRKGLLDSVRLDVFFPGFPTLKHIPHTASLKAEGVRVFEQASRGQNMILKLMDQGRPNLQEAANELLGQEIWVSWPHMVEAKVVGLSSNRQRYSLCYGSEGEYVKQSDANEGPKGEFYAQVKSITESYKRRWGVDIGETAIVVSACVMTGRKYVCGHKGKITLEKQWSKIPQPFALQTTRKDILVHDPSFKQYRTLPELFPVGSSCFMLGQPNYGCQGEVLKIDPEHKGRIQLNFFEKVEPDLRDVIRKKEKLTVQYFPGYRAAQMLGISSHLLSRLTGSMFIMKGARDAEPEHSNRVNFGLNLKFNKKNEEVCGYSKKENNQWMYSTKATDILYEYMEKFPELFDYLGSSENTSNDYYHIDDIFPESGEERLKEVSDWIKSLPCSTALRQSCGTVTLDEEIVLAIEKSVAEQKADKKKQVTMQVRPHLLYKPNLSQGSTLPDPETTFRLFDRVVNVREGYSVPLGCRGTITGIHKGVRMEDNLYDVVFDTSFPGGLAIRSSAGRSYRLPGSALINFTHGDRITQRSSGKKPTAVVPPMGQQQQQPSHPKRENPWFKKEKEESIVVPGVTPPDPRHLPDPMKLFGRNTEKTRGRPPGTPTGRGRGRGGRGGHRNGQQFKELWSSIEANAKSQGQSGPPPSHAGPPPAHSGPPPAHSGPPPAHNGPPPAHSIAHTGPPPSVGPDALSANLKSMLNIGEPTINSNVQNFFAAAASNPSASTPSTIQTSHCADLVKLTEENGLGVPRYTYIPATPFEYAQVVIDNGEVFRSPVPSSRGHASELAALEALKVLRPRLAAGKPQQFVPMQVQKKQANRRKPKPKETRKPVAEEEGNGSPIPVVSERVHQWVRESQPGQPPSEEAKPRGGGAPQRGGNRGAGRGNRKTRLAINFNRA